MQTEAMEDHNSDRNRRNDPVLNSLPAEIVDSLGTNWHLLPHSFKGSLRHMRGSFPHATKVAGTLTSANPRKELSVSFTAKLLEFRKRIHTPAEHDRAPEATKAECASFSLDCHVAGFCVHGANGVLIKAMHSKFLQAIMKYRFPKVNSLGRDMLARSGVVICAFTEYVVRPPAAAEDGGTPPALETKYVNKWAHVGYNDLVPRAIQAHILSATDGAVLSFDFNVDSDVLLGNSFGNSTKLVYGIFVSLALLSHHVWSAHRRCLDALSTNCSRGPGMQTDRLSSGTQTRTLLMPVEVMIASKQRMQLPWRLSPQAIYIYIYIYLSPFTFNNKV